MLYTFVMIKHLLTIIVLVSTSVQTQFAGCDYLQNVVPGQAYDVFSPNYGNYYPSGTNCRWVAQGPNNSKITLNCIDVVLPQNNCNDRIEIMTGSSTQNWYCNSQTFTYTTDGNQIQIALRSQPTGLAAGKFRCQLTVQSTSSLAQCDCGRRKIGRIVGGSEANVNEFTMMAGLVEGTNPSVYCGGTILSNNYVISSAHCIINKVATSLSILVGDHDYASQFETPYATLYRGSRITPHMYYDETTNINDIGILTTATSISYNVAVGPVCLPFSYENILFADQTVEGVGWGTTSYGGEISTKLKKVSLNVISNAACNNYYGNIASSQICVKTPYSDTCQRDSGGPIYGTIYGRVYLIGIISYGQGCGNDFPSVNTRVTSHLNWIRENTYGAVYCQ